MLRRAQFETGAPPFELLGAVNVESAEVMAAVAEVEVEVTAPAAPSTPPALPLGAPPKSPPILSLELCLG